VLFQLALCVDDERIMAGTTADQRACVRIQFNEHASDKLTVQHVFDE
jgi:hypothetical protein